MADKKLVLVHDWRNFPRWASMWWSLVGFLTSAASVINETWNALDHHIQDRLTYAPFIGMFLFAGTMAGRMLIWVHEEVEEHAGHSNTSHEEG